MRFDIYELDMPIHHWSIHCHYESSITEASEIIDWCRDKWQLSGSLASQQNCNGFNITSKTLNIYLKDEEKVVELKIRWL